MGTGEIPTQEKAEALSQGEIEEQMKSKLFSETGDYLLWSTNNP